MDGFQLVIFAITRLVTTDYS